MASDRKEKKAKLKACWNRLEITGQISLGEPLYNFWIKETAEAHYKTKVTSCISTSAYINPRPVNCRQLTELRHFETPKDEYIRFTLNQFKNVFYFFQAPSTLR